MDEQNKSSWEQLERLYYQGLEADKPTRAALLASYRDPALADEVAGLWGHHLQKDGILERLPQIARSFWNGFQAEKPPQQIADYQVIEALGEGGMGEVYKVQEGLPLKRVLAAKLLPNGLMTPTWITRFELEQKTLSLLNHPHIASIYDAGVTEDKRPYLVMELLEGLPIHTYCDTHRLTIPQRLELFVQVCNGVAHAHRKGVIHRDIKPSNVLIVEDDGQSTAKLIDFGISECAADRAPAGVILGTPAYMSPEQAAGQVADIDIRSDIYGLGALLYQLLLGKSPLEEGLLAVHPFARRCDLVRELRPKPLAEGCKRWGDAQVAGNRATTFRRLKKHLSGELNWITARAMAFNSEDRYATCSELVADLTRYQNNRAVSAMPHRGWYPIRKWLANHRLLMASLSTFLTSLFLALVVFVIAFRTVSASERQLKDTQKFSEDIFRLVTPYQYGLQEQAVFLLDAKAGRLEAEYGGRPDEEAAFRLVLARFYHYLGLYEQAESQYSRGCLLKQERQPGDPATLEALGDRAYNLLMAGRGMEAARLNEQARTEAIERLGAQHRLSLRLSNGFAYTLRRLNRLTEAQAIFEQTLASQQRHVGKTHTETLSTASNLGDLYVAVGAYDQAITLLGDILTQYRQATPEPTIYTTNLMDNLMLAYMGKRRFDKAIPLGEQALNTRMRLLGPLHRNTLNSINNLATAYGKAAQPDQAVTLLDTALKKVPEELRHTNDCLRLQHNLGHFLMETGDFNRADSVLTVTWVSRSRLLGASHLDTLITRTTMGEFKLATGNKTEGMAILKEVAALAHTNLEPNHPFQKQIDRLTEASAQGK